MTPNKSKMGKKSRAAGMRFEIKVRKDLESKNWRVSKWMNNVEFETVKEAIEKQLEITGTGFGANPQRKLIPAKRKYNPFKKALSIGTGFPDFIAFRKIELTTHEIIGVECKTRGYLTKEEKEKCKWLLDQDIFNQIFIARKGKKRGTIRYVVFKEKKDE